jgi:DNA polymerase V
MTVKILGRLKAGGVRLPFYSFKVPAGFPSPAADHIEKEISLDELLNLRAPHVYLVNIDGDSMEGVGIYDGDIAVVDRSITPEHGHIVIAAINNDPMCKRFNRSGERIVLTSENQRYPAKHIMEGDELAIWGVVTFSVRAHERNA